ncbi:hypothetical protein R5W23_004165 [Gemmata sp. JC673]|uniref:DDE domain-containing protein n=1 Tax=Gemmata algarum TaxID=2975278 RepID=A0ABU5F550_9BACT|nr:hypothetical protein [Gemmata algarum]MDY3562687.1 hypothetical protein [Gemmata algarum]
MTTSPSLYPWHQSQREGKGEPHTEGEPIFEQPNYFVLTTAMSWWPFPPRTNERQLDEEWSFVARKEKNGGPDERPRGDGWDHVALDPEHRLVVAKRTEDATHALVRDAHRRTGGRTMRFITSDECPVYESAIRAAHGPLVPPPRTGRPGRPRKARVVLPAALAYATVHKARENNRVVGVSTRVVFGTAAAVAAALRRSAVSTVVNTCFVERHKGADRNRCGREVRKSYGGSKDRGTHRAATAFRYFRDNFCRPVRTLRVKGEGGRTHRSRLVARRMVGLSRCATYVGHHPELLSQQIPGIASNAPSQNRRSGRGAYRHLSDRAMSQIDRLPVT